jgi:hypothetical protein
VEAAGLNFGSARRQIDFDPRNSQNRIWSIRRDFGGQFGKTFPHTDLEGWLYQRTACQYDRSAELRHVLDDRRNGMVCDIAGQGEIREGCDTGYSYDDVAVRNCQQESRAYEMSPYRHTVDRV